MQATFGSESASDRPLYSPHKALDAAESLGAVPQRLLSVLYPIWCVQVEGRQRIATDFEELEWFVERGLHEAGLSSTEGLAQFFGLEVRFVHKLVSFLRGIGHVKGDENHLALTELGKTSVQARVRFQDQETSAVLYFDGLGNRPLTREHFLVPVYVDLPSKSRFQAIPPLFCRWDDGAVAKLMQRSDRDQYGLLDEVTQVKPLRRDLAFLPIYLVERRPGAPKDLPLFLAFSRIPSKRDMVLEEAINVEQLAQVPLRAVRHDDLEHAVDQVLGQRGVNPRDWYLNPDGPWGPQVTVDARAIKPARRHTEDEEESGDLTVRDIGGHFLAYDWCIWLTCDEAGLRRQAAIERLLEWLQYVTVEPTADELRRRLDTLQERLRIQPIELMTLMDAAAQRGFACALERLDGIISQGEQAQDTA